MKITHGKWFYQYKERWFTFSTHLKKGRAFMEDGRVVEITMKSHPKIVRRILTKGERGTTVFSHRKEKS